MKRKVTKPKQEPPFFDEEGRFHFQSVSSDARFSVRLKPFPEKLYRWFERFNTYCVLECCGLNALTFLPSGQWNKRWVYNSEIMKLLQALHDEAYGVQSEVVEIAEFQQALYKSDFLFLIDYLQKEMHRSVRRMK